MANQNRQQDFDIKNQLLKSGNKFSFFQAYRLIAMLLKENHNMSIDDIGQYINISPHLSLEFPNADIANINITDEGKYNIIATFLGLYGSSSPLPTFYTENLLRDQAEDNPLAKEFIDLFNNNFYHLLYKIWSSHNIGYKIFEENDEKYLSYLYSLGGLNNKTTRDILPKECNPLRYIGILNHYPRSAQGLKTFLSDALDIRNIHILECKELKIDIPKEQKISLGNLNCRLGDDSHIGQYVISTTHAFSIEIGPIDYDTYHAVIPGSEKFRLLKNIVDIYIDQPLIWDVEMQVIGDKIPGIRLGDKRGTQLGRDTWALNQNATRKLIYSVYFNHQ